MQWFAHWVYFLNVNTRGGYMVIWNNLEQNFSKVIGYMSSCIVKTAVIQ